MDRTDYFIRPETHYHTGQMAKLYLFVMVLVSSLGGCATERIGPAGVEIPVSHLDRASAFYSALLDDPGVDAGPGRRRFGHRDAWIMVREPVAAGDRSGADAGQVIIVLQTRDIASAWRRASTVGAAWLGAWAPGADHFELRDPFGNRLRIVARQ